MRKQHGRIRQLWASWSRRRRVVITVTTAAMVALAGTAAALYLMRAPISGGVSGATPPSIAWDGATAPTATLALGEAKCTVTLTSGTLVIGMNDAFPDAQCRYKAFLKASEPSKITGLKLVGLPAGWTVNFMSCGQDLDPSAKFVEFSLRAPAGVTAPPSGTITASGSGVEAVRAAEFTAGMCA